ncbi:MAG: HEAT repeat domain-containing protein [Phycisphaerae bacterium]|nr:HEAT repeat domain-containing protein [Phycisphaerae bacterium]
MARSVGTVTALACVGWLVGVCLAQTEPVSTAPQDLELTTLSGQLTDASRSPKTKLEAASMWLARDEPRAMEILLGLLGANDNPSAQVAIAEAIATSPAEHPNFIDPLLTLLRQGDASVRAPAGRALVRQRNSGATEKLIALAKDASADGALRADLITALSAAPDKRTVEAMVGLLEDPAGAVRSAAAESLAKLTNIRAFGDDAAQWKQWWKANKDKDRSAWLVDLADSLARAKAALEADNARLRERLTRTISELYDATAVTQREAMLAGLLKDPLPDVRLIALRLVDRRIASNELVAPEVGTAVRELLADADARVRQQAAILTAGLAGSDAISALLGRLAVEDSPQVREALLTALGQLRQPEALPAVLAEINSRHENVSAAAAGAVARIASRVPLDEAQRRGASEAIVLRYKAIDPSAGEGLALREALLSAMGVVGEESFMPVLADALKDPSAKVRLAAVGALARVGKAAAAPALAALTADGDRGVRQAAIVALGSVGGKEHLPTILNLTNPAVEADAMVRQQAWDVAMKLLAEADEETLAAVADSLAARDDAAAERIQILQMRVDRLKARRSERLPQAQRRLGAALMQAQRPAEAAVQLGEARAAYAAAGAPEARALWEAWVDALLAADDPACVTAMAEQSDGQALSAALRKLTGHLSALDAQQKHLTVVLLATEALERLTGRLSAAQRRTLRQMAEQAEAKQAALDAQKVATLAPLLAGDDEDARKAAEELVAMSTRAIPPLLAELRKAVAGDAANSKVEIAIVDVLRQISPKLTGYDPSASAKAKLELIDTWSAR